LEPFYPSKERFRLAMALNNLLASPGFESWMTGEPLHLDHLLQTPEDKPRLGRSSRLPTWQSPAPRPFHDPSHRELAHRVPQREKD
jgi:hypothetical protein